MPTIKQLPSGSYNALVYDYKDSNGKRHYKSITAESKKEVKLKIAEFLAKRDEVKSIHEDITVHTAIERYIESKSNILSPSTLRGYNIIFENRLKGIQNIKLKDLSASDIQNAINEEASTLSPKSVRNTNSLLKASLLLALPNFKYTVTLPQKIKPDIQIPTESEIRAIFKAAENTRIEVPIYLAAICGMRRSEIVALKWEDVNMEKGTITIKAASVQNKNGEIVRKLITKTAAGKRTIRMFSPVLELLKRKAHETDFVECYPHPNRITDSFAELLKQLKLPHYRFHDLRHYAVSTMLLLNLPKKYIADYMGHETERMIDTVYGHVMRDKKDDFLDIVNDHYTKIFAQMQNKMQYK